MKRIALLVPFALPLFLQKVAPLYYDQIRLHVVRFFRLRDKCKVDILYCKLGQIAPPDYDIIIVPLVTELDCIADLPSRKSEDVIYLDRHDRIDRVHHLNNFSFDEATEEKLTKRLTEVYHNLKMPQLFHLSLDKVETKNLKKGLPSLIYPYVSKRIQRKIDGTSNLWIPRVPVFDEEDEPPEGATEVETIYQPSDPIYSENLPPRICMSDSIAGCFAGIFPNLYHLYEPPLKKWEQVLDLFVYCPLTLSERDTYTPERLDKEKLVWDAHLSREYCTLAPMEMLRYPLKVRLHFNVQKKKSTYLQIRPFNDQMYPLEWHSPILTKVEWILA